MNTFFSKYFKAHKDNLKNFSIRYENFLKDSKDLDFEYLTQSSSVYSSNIEGNTLDLNSFLNSKTTKNFTKDFEEIFRGSRFVICSCNLRNTNA